MKVLALLLTLLALPQYWEDSDAVKAMKNHVLEVTLAQNEGRAPGSEGEAYVADYVYNTLAENGIDMLCSKGGDVFGIVRPERGDTLVSRNVVGLVEGYDPALKNRYIVVGARMDNLGVNELTVDGVPVRQIYTGANGNASGVAVMLQLASQVARNRLLFRRSVIFVGFGASTASFAGAWNFLNNTFCKDKAQIDAMIDLDMLGMSKDGLQALTGGNADLNGIISKLASSPQPVHPTLIATEPYPSDYQVFYSQEIPSVMFTTGRYSQHNTPADTEALLDYDFMEREAEYLFNFTSALCNAPEGVPSFRNPVSTGKGNSGVVRSWADCDVPPKFMNNPDPSTFLRRWVYQYLKYPDNCVRDGIQGRVMVEFVIGRDGNLHDIHVTRGVDPELDEAALKVISASPKWTPAKVKGQKVDCSMTIPVEFKLKSSSQKGKFSIANLHVN